MARTAICDQCNADIPEGSGYIFYSTRGYGSPGQVQETGNIMLCEECTNRICTSSGFADWADNKVAYIEELRKSPPEMVVFLSMARKTNAIGIAAVCKKLGLSAEAARAKARAFAKDWWQNPHPQQVQLEAAKFWNPEKWAHAIFPQESEQPRKWWQFWK